jgi:hypothetical protein
LRSRRRRSLPAAVLLLKTRRNSATGGPRTGGGGFLLRIALIAVALSDADRERNGDECQYKFEDAHTIS